MEPTQIPNRGLGKVNIRKMLCFVREMYFYLISIFRNLNGGGYGRTVISAFAKAV